MFFCAVIITVCLMSNNLCLTFFCNRTVKYNVIGQCNTIAADLG